MIIRICFGLICALTALDLHSQQAPKEYQGIIKVNSIRTWFANVPDPDPTSLVTRPLRDVKQVTRYFDGFNRLIQTVENVDLIQLAVRLLIR